MPGEVAEPVKRPVELLGARRPCVVRAKHIPLRTCLACGQRLPQKELVRVVSNREGAVQVDFRGKQAGRGAYLCPRMDCWDKGLEKGRLDRALRTRIGVEAKELLKTQLVTEWEIAVGKGAL